MGACKGHPTKFRQFKANVCALPVRLEDDSFL